MINSTSDQSFSRNSHRRGWFFFVSMVICTAGAGLIFNLQDKITPYFNTYDFCDSKTAMNISAWIMPKLISHCDLILNSDLIIHPSSDIVILIEIYITICFIYFLSSFLYLSTIVDVDKSNRKLKRLYDIANTTWKFWGYFCFGAGSISFAIFHVFFESKIADPQAVFLAKYFPILSSDWGLGPMLQVVAFGSGAGVFLFAILLLIRIRYFG